MGVLEVVMVVILEMGITEKSRLLALFPRKPVGNIVCTFDAFAHSRVLLMFCMYIKFADEAIHVEEITRRVSSALSAATSPIVTINLNEERKPYFSAMNIIIRYSLQSCLKLFGACSLMAVPHHSGSQK